MQLSLFSDHTSWQGLLYPLGILGSILFGLRFMIQWIASEKAGKIIIPKAFWKVSVLANTLMMLHYFIQVHLPFCWIQGLNNYMSYRNLKLMEESESKKTWIFHFFSLLMVVTGIFLAFFLRNLLSFPEAHDYISSPAFLSQPITLSKTWHTFGAFGATLFALRFWLQWGSAELSKKSELKPFFWWMSIAGALVLCVYSFKMKDPITFLMTFLSLIPYMRNLYIAKRSMK